MNKDFSVEGKTLEELIYFMGKGCEIQVWDDGTVFGRWKTYPMVSCKGKTLEIMLRRLAIKVSQQI